MTVSTINFTTGPSTVPEIGTASYNGCRFSPLFFSNVSGTAVKDEAKRTVKYMEYVLELDGYVTASTTAGGNQFPNTVGNNIAPTLANMALMLTAQGGALNYVGRGFDFVVNAAGGGIGGAVASISGAMRDVAWGPVPELLDFQPLGGGLSAKVKWKVTFRVANNPSAATINGTVVQGLLQFNCETNVSYGEDYFSGISIHGTMEIPLTRSTQIDRRLTSTVDDMRSQLDARIFAGVDLSRFRVTKRDFGTSRDKRTMEFSVALEEKPYMDLPTQCTIARGSYSVRPAKAGMGLCLWLCTLRATYTVRADRSRRSAWWAFLALLRLRMSASNDGNVPNVKDPNNESEVGRTVVKVLATGIIPSLISAISDPSTPKKNSDDLFSRRAFLLDFSIDEGIYLDSKTITFSATWRLVTTFSHILLASGIWRKVPEALGKSKSIWASTIKDVSGSKSWLPNTIDPKLDVIVDFGGVPLG